MRLENRIKKTFNRIQSNSITDNLDYDINVLIEVMVEEILKECGFDVKENIKAQYVPSEDILKDIIKNLV